MLRNIDIHMILVDKVGGAEGEEVEIWIWSKGPSHQASDPVIES